MYSHGKKISGDVLDQQTRCIHYHTQKDIIAIKFYCCNTYYPCKSCHDSHGCGNHSVWPAALFNEEAILCGACGTELTINEYLNCQSICPACSSSFNPGCSLHASYYFETRHR
ncbi:CHY zinc finger protein [Jeotgalibacillus proteolyticus]|uniref:CHY zinc finger protein n=1 Tax=Jeotgalibacillus proteolyticus TaxID=2082395 RepID=UPI003CFB0948